MSPATVYPKLPALKMALLEMEKLPLTVHPDEGVTPPAFVLAMTTFCRAAGVPAIVIAPEPLKRTVPVLDNPEPRFTVFAVGGLKVSVPLLVTVPLFVKEP